MAWEDKAHRIIADLAQQAYLQANPKPRRKPRLYTLPPFVHDLVRVLGMHDRAAAEVKAKQMFAAYHDGSYVDWHLYAEET